MARLSKVLIKVNGISFYSTKERITTCQTGDDPVLNRRIEEVYYELDSTRGYRAEKEISRTYPEYNLTMVKA